MCSRMCHQVYLAMNRWFDPEFGSAVQKHSVLLQRMEVYPNE